MIRWWVARGLADGVVTTRYPARAEEYGEGFAGAVEVTAPAPPEATACCPTGAISIGASVTALDRGRCILCGECTRSYPQSFRMSASHETARLTRRALVVTSDGPDRAGGEDAAAMERLAGRTRRLKRSVHIRHIDCGSDGSEEWEVQALANPVYDVHRLGIFFTASPRHADLLLVTGPGVAGMREPLARAYEAMPEPKLVMAAGTASISGATVQAPSGTAAPGEGYGEAYSRLPAAGIAPALPEGVPVDVYVPGSPPSPFSLLFGILLVTGRVR